MRLEGATEFPWSEMAEWRTTDPGDTLTEDICIWRRFRPFGESLTAMWGVEYSMIWGNEPPNFPDIAVHWNISFFHRDQIFLPWHAVSADSTVGERIEDCRHLPDELVDWDFPGHGIGTPPSNFTGEAQLRWAYFGVVPMP